MHVWLLILAIVFSNFFPLDNVAQAVTRSEAEEIVAKEYGPTLSRRASPELYSAVEQLFDPLSAALSDKVSNAAVTVSDIRIIRSSIVNAFCITLREGSQSENLIFLTTGIIDALLADAKIPDDLLGRLYELAGVMAHELGHPIDKLDDEGGIENHYGKAGDQAIELRANNEAVAYLGKANLPINSLYKAFERLNLKSRDSRSRELVNALASTHPEYHVSMTALRARMTAERLYNATARDEYLRPEFNANALADEVKSLSASNAVRRVAVTKPGTFSQAHKLLLSTLDREVKDEKTTHKRQAAYLMWIADYFSKFGAYATWPDEQKQQIDMVYKTLTEEAFQAYNGYDDRMSVRKLKNELDTPDIFSGDWPYHKRVEPFADYFTSADFEKHIAKLFNADGAIENKYALLLLCRRMPVRDALNILFSRPEVYFSDFTLYQSSEEFKVAFHARALLWIKAILQNGQFFALLKREQKFSPWELLPARTFFRNSWANQNSLKKESFDQKNIHQMAAMIWRDRAFWGLLEFIQVGGSYEKLQIDWQGIAMYLGLDRNQVKSQILTEVKNYLRGIGDRDRPITALQLMTGFTPTAWAGYPEADIKKHRPDTPGDKDRQKEIARALPMSRLPFWVDESLLSYVSGDKTPAFAGEALQILKMQINKQILPAYPIAFQDQYIAQMAKQLEIKDHVVAAAEILAAEKRVMNQLFGQSEAPGLRGFAIVLNLEYWATVEPKVAVPLVQQYLSHLITLPNFSVAFNELLDKEELLLRAYRLMKKIGAVKIYPEFIVLLSGTSDLNDAFGRIALALHPSTYDKDDRARVRPSFTKKLAREIIAEIGVFAASGLNASQARTYLNQYFTLLGRHDAKNAMPHRDEFANVIIALEKKAQFSGAEKLRFFYKLSASVTNRETDRYFIDEVLPQLRLQKKFILISRILKSDRVFEPDLQTRLAREVLQPRVDALTAKTKVTTRELTDFSNDFREMIHLDSNLRDQTLEEWAWLFKANGLLLKAFFEEPKSSNWRNVHPAYVRVASAVSQILLDFSVSEKFILLGYLMRPEQSGQMPPQVYNAIKKRFVREALGYYHYDEARKNDALRLAYEAKVTFENAIADSTPIQRVPLIDLVISSGGSDALIQIPSQYDNLIRNFLGIELDGQEYAMLNAYLKVAPQHEKSIAIAYMLANRSTSDRAKNSNLKSLLQLFTSIGIKFGQKSVVWNIFGEDKREELEDLYDNADPMTLHQIETELDATLRPEERSHIKRLVRILGSASLKTVVLVELKDGRMAALMLRRPNAVNQIKMNASLAKDFLNELKASAAAPVHPLFYPLLESLESQLDEEVDFRNEVKKIVKLRNLYKEKPILLAGALAGWAIEIPTVIDIFEPKANAFLTSLATGVSAKEYFRQQPVNNSEALAVGEELVRFSLRMLFKFGYFDPDRSMGNFMIDRDTKKIYFIDPAQLINFESNQNPFRWDPRLTLVKFLESIQNQQAVAVVHYAKLMAEDSSMPLGTDVENHLVLRLSKILGSTSDLSVALREVVTEIYGSGLKLKQIFSFGALNGFMTLYGQNFVSNDQFMKILKEEIRDQLSRKKVPALLINKLATTVECVRALGRR